MNCLFLENFQHIFVGMHYLNVKQVQYKVNYPYSTSGPFFMQMLKRLNDKIEKGQATIQDAANIAVIEDDIMGSASPFSRGWADCDFVYLPLNNNNHWVLLVLDVKKKKIRVYNSKSRRADSVRDIRPYVSSLQRLLPKIMDVHGVYEEIGLERMENKVLELEAVEDCPQQEDG
ncbi:unnamed protein product [Cuscuta europaea]|uniref:Ubiquitin-like protease family profile domain-containing protein n=2 Tax=Cuscuta europaea TaxID=41803 RepID=A0A9P0YHW5_CUSEU|nr:unnamed protein product [Cuscuta europaea]